MSVIVLPHTPVSGQVVPSVGQAGNFTAIRDAFNNTAVQTDVAKTISVAHTFGADILFTDALYDIGKSGATRPRDLFLSRNLTVGGTAAITGNVLLNADVGFQQNTADGSDSRYTWITGGGAASSARGATILLHGNEVAGANGALSLLAGNHANGNIIFYTGADIERVRIASTGAVTLSSTLAVTGVQSGRSLDLSWGGYTGTEAALKIGADLNAATRTEAVAKLGAITVPHYNILEEAILFACLYSPAGLNTLEIGGGLTAYNAVTGIKFYTAATNTTTTGTERMHIASDGQVLIGTTVTTGSAAGELVLANTKYLRGVNAAGTTTYGLVSLDAANNALIGDGNIEVYLRSPSISAGVAQRVTAGAADSAGAGFRTLRIPN